MKKIVRLIVMLGLVAIFFIIIISFTGAARASNNMQVAGEISKLLQDDTPWFDTAWLYRRAVVVSNPGTALAYYQVLIKLEATNFNFDAAQPDGADVRFTHSDGTTELKYWIESWDDTNEVAYVWVRVPSLAPGDNTIYLYYGNPQASSTSDGNTTFDGFDENWSQFSLGGLNQSQLYPNTEDPDVVYSPFTWTTISGTPTVADGELILSNASGIKSTAKFLNKAVGMRAYFSSGAGYQWAGFIDGASGKRTMIGDLPSDPNNLYLSNYLTGLNTVMLPRVGGNDWHNASHIYEVRWSPGGSNAVADHGSPPTQNSLEVPDEELPVTLYNNNSGANTTLKVDWVYMRQYRDQEPTSSVKAEQGLVALSIGVTDNPDPIKPGATLTYQLNISNSSNANASNVVVTDTLPADVLFISASTPQGSCEGESVVVCNLPAISGNSEAWVTIAVTPNAGGWITNTAEVSSPGYELDLSDNYSLIGTLVDDMPPIVDWNQPVGNDGFFVAYGGLVTLGATASDEGGIARVEFRLWDHIQQVWITIGSDSSYPYQVQLDSSSLVINQAYQTFVVAVDKVGNTSDPYNPLRRIFIERKIPSFLPLVRR